MVDLFDIASEQRTKQNMPLAARMRPRTIDEVVGQEQIIGKGRLLRRAIEADKLSSLIFFGPPGSGKTTLAEVIANTTKSNFVRLSAVTSGIADLRAVINQAKDDLKLYNKRTVLFIDEIHRFNKSQQDALLPAVENGTVILIGATTENPYFEVNSALLSRSRIFSLKKLTDDNILELLKRALNDSRGFKDSNIVVDEKALHHLATMAGGDARSAYNALELAILTTEPSDNGQILIDLAVAEDSIQKPHIYYDKNGDWHFDVISAFIKSMRGSDANAVLHWLARMIEAGEKPEFIARRIVICSAEDVGLADPQALVVAMAAANAVHFVGWPEAQLILAEAAVYVATAPKSNSTYLGINKSCEDVRKSPFVAVPAHLQENGYKGAASLGRGIGYKYPHDYPDHYTPQQYLPDEFVDKIYYQPTDIGKEAEIKKRLQELKEKSRCQD